MNQAVERLRNLLPTTSFTRFAAIKAKDPFVIWQNPEIGPARGIEPYSLIVPTADEANGGRDVVNLYADRYGGEGLGENLGSGRCGILDDVCIKGIGPTPLVDSRTDFFHSYGGASLIEGILEAAWGEILHSAMPFGSTRVFAIIGIPGKVPLRYPRSNGPSHIQRVLILREQSLRPGHFMRACSQSAGQKLIDGVSDTDRTRNAINTWLKPRKTVSSKHSDGTGAQHLNVTPHEVAERIAKQLARARARRIMHGSLTPSNFDLDGRWLDFTSISTIPDYGRIIIPRGAPDFMNEDKLVARGLTELDYYLNKFSSEVSPPALARNAADGMRDTFGVVLSKQLPREFTQLLGYLDMHIEALPKSVIDKFFSVVVEIITPGNRLPRTILSQNNDFSPSIPRRTGTYRLGDLLSTLAACRTFQQANSLTSRIVPDVGLNRRLVESWWDIRTTIDIRFPILQDPQRMVERALVSIVLNSTHERLCRTNLYPEVENIAETPAKAGRYLSNLVVFGRHSTSPRWQSSGEIVILDSTSLEVFRYLPRRGIYFGSRRLSSSEVSVRLRSRMGICDPACEAYESLLAAM